MKIKPTGEVHVRTGPNIDVAACGERGSQLRFSWALKHVTCLVCRERRASANTMEGRREFGRRVSRISRAIHAARVENMTDRSEGHLNQESPAVEKIWKAIRYSRTTSEALAAAAEALTEVKCDS